MARKPRIILASLCAPLATLLIPVILALDAMYSSSVPGDDAPRRAGVIFIVLILLAYPIVALLMAAAGHFLSATGKLSLRNLLIGCGVLSLAAGALFGLPSPFGIKDQLFGFGIFSIVTMLSLSLGVFCWWFLAHLGQKKSVGQAMPEDT